MPSETILWRRLDAPGHDACRLEETGDGWRLDGTAVFRHDGAIARLDYRVAMGRHWRARWGSVHGWIGERTVELDVERTAEGLWRLDGSAVPGLEHCVDLDFGFTPATNLSQLRRIALAVGDHADVPVAWLDAPAGTLDVLEQRYERRSAEEYQYDAPRFGYSAVLAIAPSGFARRYPGLWEAELP
jgi:hypothetical protein